MTVQTRTKKQAMGNFEMRSVLLFSALAMVAMAQAHNPASSSARLGSRTSSSSQLTAPAAADTVARGRLALVSQSRSAKAG